MSPAEPRAVSAPDGYSPLVQALNSPGGFIKMHGAGNDFVIFDARLRPFQPDPSQIASLCNRHTGIGGDQVLVLEPPSGPEMHMRLRIYNIDGAEAQTCLNATRCVAWLMLQETGADLVRIGTGAGVIVGFACGDGWVTLTQPAARFDWQAIPLREARDTLALNLTAGPLTAQAAVSMGNPHLVCFVPSLDDVDVPRWADDLQHHPLLPEGANVGVAEIVDHTHMKLVVWERPGILTQACGSGACAATVVARRLKLTSASRIEVIMPGGRLIVEEQPDGTLQLTGPVQVAFVGTLP